MARAPGGPGPPTPGAGSTFLSARRSRSERPTPRRRVVRGRPGRAIGLLERSRRRRTPPTPGGVRRLRLRSRRPIALPGRPRTTRRRGVGLSERLRRAERNVLPAPGVGGPGPPGARAILPGDPADLFAEPPSVFRSAGADRDVPDRGTRHPDDHGLAEVSPGISSLLHLRGDVPRQSGCPRGAASGPRVRTVP